MCVCVCVCVSVCVVQISGNDVNRSKFYSGRN